MTHPKSKSRLLWKKRETSTSRTATRSRATDMFAHASARALPRVARRAPDARTDGRRHRVASRAASAGDGDALDAPPVRQLTKRGKPMPKPQKPRRRKAKTGGSQGGPGGKAAPPSAAEVAASERFDAIVAKGGAVFEVFARAAGPNQWFPVGPIAVERPRDVKKEIWKAEEPLRKAAFKMYPALAKPPAFGRIEYGYRERDESTKITEAEIRANKGKTNPFDDVILLTAVDGDDTEKQNEGLFAKFKRALNPYDN